MYVHMSHCHWVGTFHSSWLMSHVFVCICFIFQRGEWRQWNKSKSSVKKSVIMNKLVVSSTLHCETFWFCFLFLHLRSISSRTRRARSCWQPPQHLNLVGKQQKNYLKMIGIFPRITNLLNRMWTFGFLLILGLEFEDRSAGGESRVSSLLLLRICWLVYLCPTATVIIRKWHW